MKMPDHPVLLEHHLESYRTVVDAEAQGWTQHNQDSMVAEWRRWGQAIVDSIAWTDDEQRKAFADRLASIAQEAQVRREEVTP